VTKVFRGFPVSFQANAETTSSQAKTASFHIPFSSSFINRLVVRYYALNLQWIDAQPL
jgi:hypothetical protein